MKAGDVPYTMSEPCLIIIFCAEEMHRRILLVLFSILRMNELAWQHCLIQPNLGAAEFN
jgi:hypothetical protein